MRLKKAKSFTSINIYSAIGRREREHGMRKTEQRVWLLQCVRDLAFVYSIIVSGHARPLCGNDILVDIAFCIPERDLHEHTRLFTSSSVR